MSGQLNGLQLSYDVRIAILWMCAAIALTVFGVMIYSIVMFRKSRVAAPGGFDRKTLSEVVWAAIAILIVIGAVAPAVKDVVAIDITRQF